MWNDCAIYAWYTLARDDKIATECRHNIYAYRNDFVEPLCRTSKSYAIQTLEQMFHHKSREEVGIGYFRTL